MKKILLTFTFLTFIAGSIQAQDFYFGIAIGEQCAVYSKTATKDVIRTNVLFFPQSINLTFSTIFKKKLELETGIMYYIYPFSYSDLDTRISIAPNGRVYRETLRKHTSWGKAYYAISIPAHLGYKFTLANRLYANVYTGLNFDFYFCPEKGYEWKGDYLYKKSCLKRQFNILLANKVSLQYFTKFNMGIGVYGAYYSGLFQVWESVEYFYYQQTEIYPVTFLSRGSYWNFGIELGYKLEKNRERNSKRNK